MNVSADLVFFQVTDGHPLKGVLVPLFWNADSCIWSRCRWICEMGFAENALDALGIIQELVEWPLETGGRGGVVVVRQGDGVPVLSEDQLEVASRRRKWGT